MCIQVCPCNNNCSMSSIYVDILYTFRTFVSVVQLLYGCRVWQGCPNDWVVRELFWWGMGGFLVRNGGSGGFLWAKKVFFFGTKRKVFW